ncbi:MAG: TrkH family potassium uptake protein [Candidatus Methylomirabilota bacterium]
MTGWSLPRSWRPRWRPALVLAAIAAGEYLSPWRAAGRGAAVLLAAVLAGQFLWDSARQVRRATHLRTVLRARFLELALTTAALAFLLSKVYVWVRFLPDPAARAALEPVYRQYAGMFIVVAGLRLVVGEFPVRRILHRLELRPAQTVALGFALTILAGTVLLSLPPAVNHLESVSILNALFTATSAVTVTGLTVYDVGTFHTPLGQVVILGLIQLGGLGTMAASASLVVLAGRRLRLHSAAALQESMDVMTLGQVRSQIRTILLVTLIAEGIGTLLLLLAWWDHPAAGNAPFAALFHAVSAFCNAGFSTLPRGLIPFRDHWPTNLLMATLIVVGGLGFPVLYGLAHVIRLRLRGQGGGRLSLHTRLALITTAALLIGGVVTVLVLEGDGELAGLYWPERLLAAGFQSVTARTAGFSTLEVGLLRPATLWVLMGLMFIGGSPGSTAGGIKTTTAATILTTLWATVQGKDRVEAFGRTIPGEQVAKALALVGISLGTMSLGTLALLAGQSGDPLGLTFEVVSAFGTVGLSTGVTPEITAWGKPLIMGLMFVGRTGPLTLGFALATREQRSRVIYPTEKIMIG